MMIVDVLVGVVEVFVVVFGVDVGKRGEDSGREIEKGCF